jgi:transitional endoplasmic reticulum ATPase
MFTKTRRGGEVAVASDPVRVTVTRLEDGAGAENVCLTAAPVLEAMGIQERGVVEISTARDRRFLTRVSVHAGSPEGSTCAMGRQALRALKLTSGDTVTLKAVAVEEARRLVLEPLAPLSQNLQAYEDELSEALAHRQALVQEGMVIPAPLTDFRRDVNFRVLAVAPEHAVVTDSTRVVLRTSMLSPGSTANLVGFEDVGGLRAQLAQIRELVECPLLFPQVYARLGIDAPRGLILYGPPGTGKTHLARAIANEIGAHFVYVNGPEVLSSVHGGTEANLRAVFEEAMERAPAVVLIDELDSVAPRRADSGHIDARMGTQLLSLLDGLVTMEDVVVIGTTNRVEAIDAALRRPGRFDREIFVGPPDPPGRLEILRIHTREMPLTGAAEAYLPDLADAIHGYTGADIIDLLREAGLQSLRRLIGGGLPPVHQDDGVLSRCVVDVADLEHATRRIRPSALRESAIVPPRTSWDDVVGQETAVRALRDAVELPLKHWEAFQDIGLSTLPGVVLHGPPGAGKTLLAMAAARESGANALVLHGPEVFTKWLGQSEERIRDVFRLARQVAPSVVILDQLDAMGGRRSDTSSNSALERVVNQLVIELDEIRRAQVSVIGVTSRLDLVDESLLRPGRLGRHIPVELPDRAARRAILGRCLANRASGAPDPATWEIVAEVAERSEGFTPADLKAVSVEALTDALRDGGYRRGSRLEPAHVSAGFARYLDQHKTAQARMERVATTGTRNGVLHEAV